jgi:hypothetical protein
MNKKNLLILGTLAIAGFILYRKFGKKSGGNGGNGADPGSAPAITESASSSETPQYTVESSTNDPIVKSPVPDGGGVVVVTDKANPFFTVG